MPEQLQQRTAAMACPAPEEACCKIGIQDALLAACRGTVLGSMADRRRQRRQHSLKKSNSRSYMMSYPRIPLGHTFWLPYMQIVPGHLDFQEVATTHHRIGRVPREIVSRSCCTQRASKVCIPIDGLVLGCSLNVS